MLKVKNLTLSYRQSKTKVPDYVLRDLSFVIPENSITTITGESGVGKTTLAKTLVGQLPETARIHDAHFYIRGIKRGYHELVAGERLDLFYAPQNAKAALNPVLKLKAQFSDFYGRISSELLNLLESFSFDSPERILNTYPFELSEGECKRLVIAIGLLLKPALYILDEPMISVDITSQYAIASNLINFMQQSNRAMVIISHNYQFLHMLKEAAPDIPFHSIKLP